MFVGTHSLKRKNAKHHFELYYCNRCLKFVSPGKNASTYPFNRFLRGPLGSKASFAELYFASDFMRDVCSFNSLEGIILRDDGGIHNPLINFVRALFPQTVVAFVAFGLDGGWNWKDFPFQTGCLQIPIKNPPRSCSGGFRGFSAEFSDVEGFEANNIKLLNSRELTKNWSQRYMCLTGTHHFSGVGPCVKFRGECFFLDLFSRWFLTDSIMVNHHETKHQTTYLKHQPNLRRFDWKTN